MTPEEINALVNAWAWADSHGPGLVAGGSAIAALWACHRLQRHITTRRALRRTPAAPDNQPPTDVDALITCRRIAALHTADPAMWRQADHYLRQKGDDQL